MQCIAGDWVGLHIINHGIVEIVARKEQHDVEQQDAGDHAPDDPLASLFAHGGPLQTKSLYRSRIL